MTVLLDTGLWFILNESITQYGLVHLRAEADVDLVKQRGRGYSVFKTSYTHGYFGEVYQANLTITGLI